MTLSSRDLGWKYNTGNFHIRMLDVRVWNCGYNSLWVHDPICHCLSRSTLIQFMACHLLFIQSESVRNRTLEMCLRTFNWNIVFFHEKKTFKMSDQSLLHPQSYGPLHTPNNNRWVTLAWNLTLLQKMANIGGYPSRASLVMSCRNCLIKFKLILKYQEMSFSP